VTKTPIDKKTLEYLAELSRIEIDKKQEGKLLNDLRKILGHFEELKEVNTENVEPMAGGTIEKNVFREDKESSKFKVQSSKLTGQFPEKENGFLKIPPVFE
jgi:aspartyl-tRNA(Asn)/glutamyl-tRNA(Gln) amidotransferase subunit C